ncbi:hypothetical protein AAG570_001877 [Ranatra chinensis]|uniref:Selenoprotein T n=1 Tax=Ranatra chinensis TaxID=642074 RepID=A0ABD0YLP6_9HEMI
MVEYSKAVYFCIFIYFTVCTFKDVYVQTEKQIPMTKVGLGTNIGPTLKFLYCYSCGYRKLFDDYANIIRQKYPDISVRGENYDPPGIQMMVAKTLGLSKIILVICFFFGINLFAKFGVETPNWWTWCMENKIYSSLMVFFLFNAIENHLVSTGAFEIMLNDMPVWSKLETGRIPQPPELFQIIDNHMMFHEDPSDVKPGFPK